VSLVGFHKFLIGSAVVFCGFFAVWSGAAYFRSGEGTDLLVSVGFGAAAVGLVYYLRHLDRFLGRGS